jgi:fucose permease
MNYRGLTQAIFAGAFVFGIVMASLGALLPALVCSIGFEKAAAGTLFLVMNFGMLVGSLIFGPICDRFGFRILLLISTLLIGGAFLSLSQASGYLTLLLTLPMLGFGGGMLNGAANALLNDISAERRSSALNLLGIYFGIGALLTPFAIGVLIGNLGLSTILLGFAVFSIAPAPLFLLALFPAPKHEGGISWKDCARMLSKPILLLFGLLLFFQSGNEFTIGGWVSTYLGERFTLDADYCAYALVGYWLAMMLGRWTASRMGRVSPSRLVLYSS